MSGQLYVISGPSGSGKSTICRILEKEDNIKISVSATTRKPRKGEKDGINYYFLSREEFEEKIKRNAFYEYARVFENYYGTLRETVDEMLSQGFDVILEIDVQGAVQIMEKRPDAVTIFILPPDRKTLLERLSGRETETREQIELRTKEADRELSYKDRYDYRVINDDLDLCVKEILEIMEKEDAGH